MDTTVGYDTTTGRFLHAMEEYARFMADHDNDCEGAWFLRGFADRFIRGQADDAASRGEYGREYRNGWNAGNRHSAH